LSENNLIVKLYGASSCHLCEKAEAILGQSGVAYTRIDIRSDSTLLKKYGLRIPVLQRTDNGAELDWPFDPEDADAFLRCI